MKSIDIDHKFIYESFPDMCLSLDTETGKIISCNSTLTQTLGYTKQEILNSTLFDLYHPNQKEKVKDNLESIRKNERPKNSEFLVQKKNGETIEVSLKLNFVRNESGQVLYSNAVWRDITELKNIQRELVTQNQRIEQQKLIIESKNKEYLDALNYAKYIQDGILPSANEIRTSLPNSFVFFQPKSVVSGDFYWIHEAKKHVIFCVCDCTGHGVPGAFMSMIGAAALNEIITKRETFRPDEILNLLRAIIIKSINKGRERLKISDGMDAALCMLNKEDNLLYFAGAQSNLILIRPNKNGPMKNEDGEILSLDPIVTQDEHALYEIKGDKQPIGYFQGMGKLFCMSTIRLEKGDHIYLFSDGFKDQFGGALGKKFLSKRFRAMLIEASIMQHDERKELLSKRLNDWRGKHHEQTDDICVWGVEI